MGRIEETDPEGHPNDVRYIVDDISRRTFMSLHSHNVMHGH